MPAFRGHLAFSGSSSRHCRATHQQSGTGHPQVRQSKQGVQLLGVLAQASVTNFDMTKLAFDDPEWMLDFGPNAGLDLLKLLLQSVNWLLRIQGFALLALHRNVPA